MYACIFVCTYIFTPEKDAIVYEYQNLILPTDSAKLYCVRSEREQGSFDSLLTGRIFNLQ